MQVQRPALWEGQEEVEMIAGFSSRILGAFLLSAKHGLGSWKGWGLDEAGVPAPCSLSEAVVRVS